MPNLRRMIASFSMVAILSSLLVSATAVAGTYKDVPADSYYYEAVEALAGAGVLDASKTEFKGGDELNRNEAAKLAVLAAGFDKESPATATFKDVPKTAWEFQYVETAVAHSVLSGYGDKPGYFGPGDKLIRSAYAKILVNALDLPEYTPTTPTFSDVPATDSMYKYVETAYHWSVVDGKDGKFNPTGRVLRAEAAVMTHAAMNPIPRGGDTTGDDTTGTGGALEVSLSNDSPDGGNIPGLVENAVVAKYDFTAGGDDVKLQELTITRGGLNDTGSVNTVALFDGDGNRISNAKSFNSSDNAAVINLLNNGLTIPAGKTVTISVVGQVGNQTTYSGQTFLMEIASADDVVSDASDTTGDFPIKGETFAIGSVNAGELQINANGIPGSVKVGEEGVDVSKFKIKNNSSNNQKIEFTSITLKEEGTVDENSELANFELFIDGKSVSKVDAATGKYVSFVLDDALTLDSGKSATAVVKADIVGGPTKTIAFQVNSDLDVGAQDLKYGFGAQIDATSFNAANDGTSASKRVLVDAGAVTVVGVNATATDILKDKKDVILGTIKVTANAGKDLELQKVNVNIENTYATTGDDTNVSAVIENVELYDGSSIYDLTCTDANGSELSHSGDAQNCVNSDLSINLADGKTAEFQIRADTKNVDLATTKLVAKLPVIGTATKSSSSFYIEETGDDNAVTDITPSTLTFKAVNGQVSGATASVISMSTTNAVVGTESVPSLKFQIRAGLSSDITFNEVDVTGTYNGGAMSSTHVSKISLYKGETVSEANLVKSVTGSKIASGVVTFDNLNLDLTKNTTQKFLVTVNLVDDSANAGHNLSLAIASANDVTLQDQDSEDVTCGGSFPVAGRTIAVTNMGEIDQTVYTSSSVGLNKDRNVLANTTSDFVAGYEFTVSNEPILLKDLTVANVTGGTDLQNLVSEVILIGDDKTTELGRETVASDTVNFTDLNKEMPEGTYKVFVKVLARKIGKNEVTAMNAGYQLSLVTTNLEGVSSGKTVDDHAVVTATHSFYVVPVLADVAVATLPSAALKTGAPTTLARVTVTPKVTTNTDVETGATLKTQVRTLKFTVKTMSNIDAEACSGITLKKVGTSVTVAGASCSGSNLTSVGDTITFTLTGMSDPDNYNIDSATTYEVNGALDVHTLAADAYFELELVDSSTPVVIGSDDTNTSVDDAVNLVLPSTIEFGETKFTGTGA